jgi:type II secretory ATPase GspE/PulE/Tfp pilus assembly ATPase PilB-like protein
MKTIGSILLDVELVSQENIDRALELQKQTGQRLGEVLVSLGLVSDDDIRWALAEQLNLPYVNIRKDQIDIEVATLLPEKLARRYHVIPILKIDDELTVVVDDPLNTTIIKDIEAVTKSRVKVSLGRTSDIMLAIDEIYGSAEEDFEKRQEAPPHFLSSWFDESDIQAILNDPSGRALLQRVLENAFDHGISRMYFQPGFDTCHVSYRINGIVQQQVQLGKEWYSIVMFRLKISAGFELSKALYPQYREFSYWEHVVGKQAPVDEAQVRIAVSIFPTTAGESAILHVINRPIKRVKEVGREAAISSFQKNELLEIGNIKAVLQHLKSGAVFLAGSPYSDRIMTLYSLLNELDHVRKNIVTLESYTEYSTDGYAQIRYARNNLWDTTSKGLASDSGQPGPPKISSQQLPESDNLSLETQKDRELSGDVSKRPSTSSIVNLQQISQITNPDQKLLSSWLSALKHQDADVMLVDRIGSDVVLSQCLEYAAHQLLLGAFDCKHVFEILAYCLDCQVKPSTLVFRVYALLAQQTVHILCQECKQKDNTDFGKQFLDRLPPTSVEQHTDPQIFVPVGCPACHMTGYSDRVVLFEVLKMEPWLKEMLAASPSLTEIRNAVVEKGFVSLKQKSIDLLLTGETSIGQILSIVT